MIDLAAGQAQLVAALTGTGPIPRGFDADRLEVARKALLRKRSDEVARSWPRLRQALGDRFGAEFAQWAAHRPTAGSFRDGWDFAVDLTGRSALPATAGVELAERRVRWRYDGRRSPRRRRLPAIAVVDRRLVVQVAGRVGVFGCR